MTALVDEQRLETAPHTDFKLPHVKLHTTGEIVRWLRTPRTIWCPGCSNGTITRALVDAILGLELDPQKVVVVAGIGCSGRIAQYLDFSTVHTAHGRALAVATGARTTDSSLHVIVAMGDGDCSAIGGNHFIHAARRNIDVTALVFNNSIYGMTGGQMSPTTHTGDKSTTSVFGNVEPAFDLCELARAAGATYVARGTAWGYRQLVDVIAGGIAHKGFSMVEAMAVCPVYYGRFNLTPDPAEFLKVQKERSVPASRFEEGMSRLHEQYPVGLIHHAERREFAMALAEVAQLARERALAKAAEAGPAAERIPASEGDAVATGARPKEADDA